jgi:hypothetical protein
VHILGQFHGLRIPPDLDGFKLSELQGRPQGAQTDTASGCSRNVGIGKEGNHHPGQQRRTISQSSVLECSICKTVEVPDLDFKAELMTVDF